MSYRKYLSGLLVGLSILVPNLAYGTTEQNNENVLLSDPSTMSSKMTLDIKSTTIDIVVPLSLQCSINVNTEYSNAFISPNLEIVNNTNAPIHIEAKTIMVGDEYIPLVNHDKFSDEQWEKLNTKDSSSNLALGLQPVDVSNMMGDVFVDNWFTVQNGQNPIGFSIGTIKPKSSISVKLIAKHGMIFKEPKQLGYGIQYIARLL